MNKFDIDLMEYKTSYLTFKDDLEALKRLSDKLFDDCIKVPKSHYESYKQFYIQISEEIRLRSNYENK